MQVLWAPWRGAYVSGPKTSGCIFCTARDTSEPRQHLVLARAPVIVMLNKFPYGSGHLMVAPRRHTADFAAMPTDELHTLMEIVQRAADILIATFAPNGMNIGINLGAAGGAGITDHLHWHLVPRWTGDTNFMPLFTETRVISEHLAATYDKLHPLFAAFDSPSP